MKNTKTRFGYNEEEEKFLEEFFSQEIDPEIDFFVDYSMAIAVQVAGELERRGMTQKDLARQMGKRESEISKWLSGLHNFTLRSLAKLSAALNKKLIYTEEEAKETFLPQRTYQFHIKGSKDIPAYTYHNDRRFSKSHMQIIYKKSA